MNTEQPLVSIVILNYNYGRYLAECIDSALTQDYAPIEVFVVDDGSTDDSRAVIATFGDRITASFKRNGGMVSSMNHGFTLARGAIVMFLDADDYLLPGAVADHVRALRTPGVVRSQAYLEVLSDGPAPLSRIPGVAAGEGDLRELILARGPGAYVSSPTSGNAWSRDYLARVFPLPEDVPIGAETFLMDTAPLFGTVVTLKDAPRGVYRYHAGGMNAKKAGMTAENIQRVLAQQRVRAAWLERIAQSLGYDATQARWKSRNWRLLTLDHLAARLSGAATRVGLAEHLRAVHIVQGGAAKRAALALTLLGIRVAPLGLSLYLASRVINLRYM